MTVIVQCAACRTKDGTGGALPCDAIKPGPRGNGGNRGRVTECPDSLVSGKWFMMTDKQQGECISFSHQRTLARSVPSTTRFKFGNTKWGVTGKGMINTVLTKAAVGHPSKAPLREGWIALTCTVMYKLNGLAKGEVMKVPAGMNSFTQD